MYRRAKREPMSVVCEKATCSTGTGGAPMLAKQPRAASSIADARPFLRSVRRTQISTTPNEAGTSAAFGGTATPSSATPSAVTSAALAMRSSQIRPATCRPLSASNTALEPAATLPASGRWKPWERSSWIQSQRASKVSLAGDVFPSFTAKAPSRTTRQPLLKEDAQPEPSRLAVASPPNGHSRASEHRWRAPSNALKLKPHSLHLLGTASRLCVCF
mmetsp:Transcript_163678/g.524892  ORF Transcript_163678/g.524892 Transcript_163678/m.524892 type:complete len:217 (+) Transcript_163678:282-932(+)